MNGPRGNIRDMRRSLAQRLLGRHARGTGTDISPFVYPRIVLSVCRFFVSLRFL